MDYLLIKMNIKFEETNKCIIYYSAQFSKKVTSEVLRINKGSCRREVLAKVGLIGG